MEEIKEKKKKERKKMLSVHSYSDFEKQRNGCKVLILKVSTTWCKVCRNYQPVFEKFAQKYDKGTFAEIPDLDKWSNKEKKALPFTTHKYPRFVLFRKGKILKVCKRKTLQKYLDKYVY